MKSKTPFSKSSTLSNLQSLTSNFPIGLITLWLLTLPAITPFIQPAPPQTADGLLHLYRVVALDQAIQQGVFFPRWLPDLAFGYGLPLFVFYAPLAYYLTIGLHLLGFNFIQAFNLSSSLAILVAGTGVYLWVTELGSPRAAILAGVAYVYAPYHLFEAFSRGSLPSMWAAALFPLVFWAFSRLRRTGQVRDMLLSAVCLAAALLSHNISSLLFFPLLLFYLAIQIGEQFVASRQGVSLRPYLLRIIIALSLGIGLTAFFWLPAVAEKEFVQIERVITPPDFDYRAHFVAFRDLFRLPKPANTGLLNPNFPLTLGLAQVGLAVLSFILFFTGFFYKRIFGLESAQLPSPQPSPPGKGSFTSPPLPRASAPLLLHSPALLIFATTALLITIFMTLPPAAVVWDRLPLIAFVQHPDRLLSVAALLLALLAGAGVAALPERMSLWGLIIGISLIFLSAVPLLYPRYYEPLPPPLTPAGMMTYEQSIGAIGTTSFGEYVPVWVEQTPHESPLLPLYQAADPIERLDPAYLPASTTVESSHYAFNRAELTIDAPQPFQAVFHTFYFPGWQAQIDGKPASVSPVTERGLIGVDVPPGRHQLRLNFTETPIRLTANFISLASLIIIGLLIIYTFRPRPTNDDERPMTDGLRTFAYLTTLALLLILTKTLYLDRFDSPLKHTFDGQTVRGVEYPLRVNFGQQLYLLGYDLPKERVASGQTFDLTLYWQAHPPLATDYSILVHLVDEEQHLYGGYDTLHPGNLPTSRWSPWTFTRDPHPLRIPLGTPPGDYFLVTGPYAPQTWARLPVVEGGVADWPDVLPIPVTIVRPAHPPNVADLGIAWPTGITPVPTIKLLGATPERQTIIRNDFLRLALFWEALEQPQVAYQVQVQMVTEAGEVFLEGSNAPSHGRYPTTQWRAGERVRDNHAFWIPPDFPAGTYNLRIRLLNPDGQPAGKWVQVGSLDTAD